MGSCALPDSTTTRSAHRRTRRCSSPSYVAKACLTCSTWLSSARIFGMGGAGGSCRQRASNLLREASESPAERVRFVPVPVANERQDGALERVACRERRMLEHASLQDAEPYLDLVHPRRVLRRVDEVEAFPVARVELLPPRALVDDEVVPRDVDGPAW